MMASDDTQAARRQAQKIQTVDTARPATDPFKLPASLRALLDSRLTALDALGIVPDEVEGARQGASEKVKKAYKELRVLLKEGFEGVQSTPRAHASGGEKAAALATYGWVGGKLGRNWDNLFVVHLAELAVAETPKIAKAALRYPAEVVAEIAAQLAIVRAEQAAATTGARQDAIAKRDTATALLVKALRRVRFHYGSASDDCDETPELAKIGFQPTRRSGQRLIAAEQTIVTELLGPPDTA
jgi:hypothetical protein